MPHHAVISAQNLLVINTTFSNTFGTPPASGVDLEPDPSTGPHSPYDPLRLTNLTFKNCLAANNQGDGFGGYFSSMLSYDGKKGDDSWAWHAKHGWAKGAYDRYPLTVLFDNCSIRGGGGGWSFGTIYPNLPGSIVIQGGEVTGTARPGVHISSKALSSATIKFVRHTIRNVATNSTLFNCSAKTKAKCPHGQVNTPILVVARHGQTPEIEGGVSFEDCVIEDSRARPWLQLIGDAHPQKPAAPYPAAAGQGRWANVNLTNLRVTTVAPHLCAPQVLPQVAFGDIRSVNVSCE